MPDGVGCALCGRAAVTRRIDLTDSDVSARDITDYDVRGVLRGVLLCPECLINRTIGQLLAVRGGVELVRGCMVQCADVPPWWLRWSLPGGVRVWRKTVCPCCGGKAQIQVISEAVERPESALRRGLREAFGLLAWWRQEDDYGLEEAEDQPAVTAIEGGGEAENEESAGNVIGHN